MKTFFRIAFIGSFLFVFCLLNYNFFPHTTNTAFMVRNYSISYLMIMCALLGAFCIKITKGIK